MHLTKLVPKFRARARVILRRSGSVRLMMGVLLMMAVLMAAQSIQGDTRFFPIEKVKPGMIGFGYTVFTGTRIDKFEVKVLAVVDNDNHQGKLILVKLSGKLLQQNGGLSGGMSGSPIYFHGKLAGAVSYGFENADPFLALVTPIDRMMRLFTDAGFVARADAGEPPPALFNFALKPVPVTNPVLVSGMGPRGYELVKQSLQDYGLTAVDAPGVVAPEASAPGHSGAGITADSKVTLLPGSAIGVQMVAGDYQVATLGTVTFIDGQNFLAFGHPFTNKGRVDYLAFNAFIFQTVTSPVMSFKLGAPVQLIGRISEDRSAGILGQLGQLPDLISITANVKDITQDLSRDSSFQVINHEADRELITAGVTDAIDQTIDRVGGGTATVDFTIETGGQALISRQNMFYGKDIAVDCLKDLKEILDLMAANEYATVSLKSIRVEVTVSDQQSTARITNLNCERDKVKPGETFLVKALLHTYRGIDLTIPFTVKLPDNFPPGKITLTVHGGSKDTTDGSETSPKKDEPMGEYQNTASVAELFDKFSSSPKNNELMLEYYPANAPKTTDADNPGLNDLVKPEKMETLTDYVVLGESQLTLVVEN